MKTFIISIMITSALMASFSGCQQTKKDNPLLQESKLPFGAPDFSKIQNDDYLPAFQTAIQATRDSIDKIVNNPDSATF